MREPVVPVAAMVERQYRTCRRRRPTGDRLRDGGVPVPKNLFECLRTEAEVAILKVAPVREGVVRIKVVGEIRTGAAPQGT